MTDEQKLPAEQVSGDHQKNIEKILARLEGTRTGLDKFADVPKEFAKAVAVIVEQSTSYVSKVIAIGYASFFGIWAIAKGSLLPGQNLIIATCMIGSVGLFVTNEIHNVLLHNRLSNLPAFNPTNLDTFEEDAKNVVAALEAVQIQGSRYRGLRRWVLIASISLASIGVAVMAWGTINGLWRLYSAQK